MHKGIRDRTNEKHGLWIVKEFDQVKNTNAYWYCECTGCNKIFSIGGSTLGKLSNGCKKCRTAKKEKVGAFKHGKTHSKTWNTWISMVRRCTDKNHDKYKYYGERGITIDKNWLDQKEGFNNFLKDMGERPLNHELDRIDNSGNYTKENCRWVTKKENCRNKSNNANYTYKNKTQCASAWAEELGLHYKSFMYFLREKKVSFEEAIVCCRKI
jgi:hypothetical protein